MQRMALILAIWLAGIVGAFAQNVTVIGPITPGNCPQFSSTTVLKDSGALCNGSSPTSPSASVGLTVVPGTATSAMRSDAAPPLSASVQSALTGTNNGVALGTGAFGFGTTAVGANSQALFGNTGLAPTFRQPAFTDLTGTATPTQGGTGANNATNAANDILASNGANGNFVHTAFSTLVNAFCTASPSSCASVFGYVSPFWYGAKCDGSTNDTTAIQSTLTNSAGQTIFFPAGTCLISATLTVPANTTVTGAGWNSVIKTSATTGVFNATNVSNIKLSNFTIQGSDNWTTQATSSYGPIIINQTGAVAGTGYDFQNLKMLGFNTSFWVWVSTVGSTASLGPINFSNNWLASTAADAPADNAGHNGNNDAIYFQTASAGNGQIHDVTIHNNRIDGTAFCIGVFLGANITNFQVISNYITNVGASVTAHCNNAAGTTINAYGVAVYDLNNDGFVASKGQVSLNNILAPYSSGIYLAGVGSINTSVVGNTIYGQVSADDALLPRAAISINTYTDITVVGNHLYQGYGGVVASGQTSGTIAIISNDCVTTAGSSFCYKEVEGTGTTNTDNRVVKSNYANALLYGIWLVSSSTAKFNTLYMSDNTTVGGTNGINLNSPFVSNEIILDNNTASGSTGLNIGTMTGSIELKGNTILNAASAGIAFAALPNAINSSQVYVTDGTAGSSPCTGAGTGTTAFRQNGAWKCF